MDIYIFWFHLTFPKNDALGERVKVFPSMHYQGVS